MSKIAIAGLGKMGLPITTRLLRAGHLVNLFDFTKSARSLHNITNLANEGANLESTIEGFLREVDYVFTFLPDDSALKDVLLTPRIRKAIGPLTIIVDFSTTHPQTIIDIANDYKRSDTIVLDCPVSGGVKGAIEGELSILASGDRTASKELKNVVSCFSKKYYYLGEVGNGKYVKAANQWLIANNLIGVAIAIDILSEADIEVETLEQVISSSSGASYAFSHYFSRMINKDYETKFSSDQMLKDLLIGLELMKNKSPFAREILKVFNSRDQYQLSDISAIRERI